jgi:hypothetical protein
METNNSQVTLGPGRGDAAAWAENLNATRKNSLIYRLQVIYAEKYTIAEVQAVASAIDGDSREYRAALNVLVQAGLASEFKQPWTAR